MSFLQELERADHQMRDLYWQDKNLPAAVRVAQGMLDRATTELASVPEQDLNSAKASVKVIAYNLASFVWPGWDEPGMAITPEYLQLGLEAARLNLKLAIELNKPVERVRDAHWLIAAMHIAQRDLNLAEEHLELARREAPSRMIDGYLALCRVLGRRIGAEDAWSEALLKLEDRDEPDGREFIEQLKIARNVFERAST